MRIETERLLRDQLVDRRRRLDALTVEGEETQITRLLLEVNSALDRMGGGTYGTCEKCCDPLNEERLWKDPLCRLCLSCMPPDQIRSLERDLELASRIQTGLLPDPEMTLPGWEISTRYAPAGPVSGDYYDIIHIEEPGEIYVVFGDVSGKGVSASLLMSNLHAIFRSLVRPDIGLVDLMEQANRLFTEVTPPEVFVTLVCARLHPNGLIEVANGGHLPPMLTAPGGAIALPATGLPLGLFTQAKYEALAIDAEESAVLLLYTDGVTEAHNRTPEEFGETRVRTALTRESAGSSAGVLETLLREVDAFRNGSPQQDDVTVMAIRRTSEP